MPLTARIDSMARRRPWRGRSWIVGRERRQVLTEDLPQGLGFHLIALFQQVMRKEKADGTIRPRDRALVQQAFGRPVS